MHGVRGKRGQNSLVWLGLLLSISGGPLACGDDGPAPHSDPPPEVSTIDSVQPDAFAITLHWTSSREEDFARYVLQRSAIGLPAFDDSPDPTEVSGTDPRRAWINLEALAQPTDTVWTDSLVSPGHQYDYRVVTFDLAEQSTPSDSITTRTLPAPFPVLGMEPRLSLSDPFVGTFYLWIDGIADSSFTISDILVEFVLPKFAVFSTCDLTGLPLSNWISLCQSDPSGVSLGWSRLPDGSALSNSAVLAEIEAQVPLAGEFAPEVVEVFNADGELVIDRISVRGILPPDTGRPR